MKSAVESLESETTVVKKSVKKSVKTSKTTSKKKTISTTESSSITSSKAESFENSFSNGSIEVVEQHHMQEHKAVHQESVMSSKSIDSSSGKEVIEAIQDSVEKPSLENGEKKKLNGKKKVKKSKKSDEKENISVVSETYRCIHFLVFHFHIPGPLEHIKISCAFDLFVFYRVFILFSYFTSCWLSRGAFPF
jgi:hypothetical protein